jgi:phosphocarrier protein HPr
VGLRRVIAATPLHARPAAVFVKAVVDSRVPVTIGRPGREPVDARSIVSVLSLDVRPGDEVVLDAPDGILADLAALVSKPK